MAILKLGKYAGDDHHLIDEGDAEFLRRKLGPDVILDFTGVADVSPAFLDALLENETPESIGDRVTGLSSHVDRALASWVDRRSQPIKPIERPRARLKVKIPPHSSLPSPIERTPSKDDRFTP